MYTSINSIEIKGIASAAPTKVLDNEQFALSVEDKRYKRRITYTGIKQRHATVGSQTTSDLACIAADAIVEKLGWKKNSIDALVYVTQTPDLYAPSTAMIIQTKLGLSQDIIAFDVNLGCSGFTTGIQIMSGLLSNIKGKGLLLMGDCQKYGPGMEFDESKILFGDGASAVAMEYDKNADVMQCFQMTDGSRYRAICSTFNEGHMMDGNEIVLFSLNEVVQAINEFHDHFNVNRDEVDFYALHQAQKIIVDGIASNCNLDKEKTLEIYQRYGNTSSASIPFALCGNVERYGDKDKLKIFSCGFGIGLAWSGVLFTVESDMVLPIIESDNVYPSDL